MDRNLLLYFNTASVPIQLVYFSPRSHLNSYFNTASVPIQLLYFSTSLPCKTISIQLLFLFNLTNKGLSLSSSIFQYSFCSYSTNICISLISSSDLFQYSFCSYSTMTKEEIKDLYSNFNTASVPIQPRRMETENQRLGEFQYSFCSYSTLSVKPSRKILAISIQLLFLFNLKTNQTFPKTVLFQYSFCSYST